MRYLTAIVLFGKLYGFGIRMYFYILFAYDSNNRIVWHKGFLSLSNKSPKFFLNGCPKILVKMEKSRSTMDIVRLKITLKL